MRRQIEGAPIGRYRLSESQLMRAGIVRGQSSGACFGESLEPRIRQLNREVQALDRGHDFIHCVGLGARGNRRPEPERKLRLCHAHEVPGERAGGVRPKDRVLENAPRKRAIDIDVLLPAFTGRRDLPADAFGRQLREGRLRRIPLAAGRWCRRLRQLPGLCSARPQITDQIRCLFRVCTHPCLPRSNSHSSPAHGLQRV